MSGIEIEAFENIRVDLFISKNFPEYSRNFIQRLIDSGNCLVNGKPVKKNYKLYTEDKILLIKSDPVTLENKAQEIPIDIIYEDSDLLVINKQKGIVVHPAAGNYENTLVNALLFYCKDLSGINGVARPGIVHRLDKDTSGLLIVAKNDFAHKRLAAQIKTHSFERCYEAVVYGHFKEHTGVIDLPIGRSEKDRKKMAVTTKNSKKAVTNYHVIAEYEGFSHIRVKLETGRTHQIRVHLNYLQHSVIGDTLYTNGRNRKFSELNGQCLHAKYIKFEHPRTKQIIELESLLPDYFTNVLKTIGNEIN